MRQNCHPKEFLRFLIHLNPAVCVNEPKKVEPVLKIVSVICRMLSHESLQVPVDCLYQLPRIATVSEIGLVTPVKEDIGPVHCNRHTDPVPRKPSVTLPIPFL
mgnify:CR=1 FL=1